MKQRVVSLSDFGPAENMSLIETDIPTPRKWPNRCKE